MYATNLWGELEDSLKDRMVEHLKNSLTASKLIVPKAKELINRLKGFYSSRRNTELLKGNEDKWRKRKLAVKASRLTYVSHL